MSGMNKRKKSERKMAQKKRKETETIERNMKDKQRV